MTHYLAIAVSLTFALLSLWHLYMAMRPTSGASGAVPSVGGKPLFVPSRRATLAVAVVLLMFAGLVAVTGSLVSIGMPPVASTWLSYALACGLLARAVGDFRYVGFFKRVRDSKFATLDTRVYSPLCFVLAAGVAFIASQHVA